MSYVLSVDLGTTFTSAAVCQRGGEPKMLSLGSSGYAVPSALFLRDDGTFIAGEAAELRSSADPTRVARYFKRRLGDEVPVRLAGTPFAPEVLVTRILEWVIGQATERNGGTPEAVVLTHPANWGPYRRELLQQAATMAGASRPLLIAEPEAAAIHYVQSERIEPGELLAVYDLGGGTFDAVVMRRTHLGFEALGRPAGVDRLGGLDFDDVIRSFVLEAAELDDMDEDEEASVTAAYALQSSCIDAKRVLSADTVADVRVVFPSVSTSVRVTRAEFEARIRPRLVETLSALEAAITSAEVQTEDISRILLVGGSSRVPLVSALLAQRFGRPLAVDSDPKNTVALGAARFGARSGSAANPAPPSATPPERPLPLQPPTEQPRPEPPRPGHPAASEFSAPTEPIRPTSETIEDSSPPSTVEDSAGELFSVRTESGHRTRLPLPSDPIERPTERSPGETKAVGLDPKLLVFAAAVAVVVVAIIAVALFVN